MDKETEMNELRARIEQATLSVLTKFLLLRFIPPVVCGNATSFDCGGRVRYRYYDTPEGIDQTLKEINNSGIATARSEVINIRGEGDRQQVQHFLYVEFL